MPRPSVARPKPRPQATSAGAHVPDDGVIRVGCEKRRGGVVTLVYGLQPKELEAIAAVLKKRCGAGGTAKDGIVAIQGDKRDAVIAYFAEAKRHTKRMGG